MPTTLPKVSIITPSYNQAQYLEETINSVLSQDYPNLEYIIIDGGSTDGSLEIIKKYESQLAYWICEPDDGQSDAINKGLKRVTGEIWGWLNSDDIYLPGAVSKAISWLSLNPQVGIVYGDCNFIDKYGQFIGCQETQDFDFISYLVNANNYIPSSSTFIRMENVKSIGMIDVSLHMMMDMDYWLRAGLYCQIAYMNVPLSSYRIYPEAKTWNPTNSEKKAIELIKIYQKLYNQPDNLPSAIQKVQKQALSTCYRSAANFYYKANEKGKFWATWRKSLIYGPATWKIDHLRMFLRAVLGERKISYLQSVYHYFKKRSLNNA
jgi:glycosyltransferase involved in cell wall biosynthesis